MIKNINESFGDSVTFNSPEEMENAIKKSGYTIPEDGLKKGRDYDLVWERPSYCVQNAPHCRECSLTNYGRDCENNQVKS